MKIREDDLQKNYNQFEQNLTFLGITAVEDKLQYKVPETLKMVSDASIRIWILTGDKIETA